MEPSGCGHDFTLPKRKRGRPPKVRYPTSSEAEFPASHLTDDKEIEGLQLAYKPLKEIMGISKLRPLVEKPDELLYGLYDYYDIIDKPMWFLEMTRKYAEKEYKNVVEVMEDVRLVLENCYRFWGKKHKFVKQALRAEKIVAKHVAGFPPEIKAKCCLALYDKEDALATELDSNGQLSYMTDDYTSKILQNLEKKPISTKMDATLEEMQKWEDEILQAKQHNRQINLVPELAEVGQFLVMAREILCLKPISQYEIERMLMIPRESSTLATIMTSFLCPTAMRAALYFKPIMIYDVWCSLLQKKLESWYNTYTKYNNRMQVFLKYGVEPSFFDSVGETNPLSDTSFHELSLVKKSSILKALCSNMFHSNKKIEEYFNLVEENSLKSRNIHSDSKYDYVSLFSPEIRIYRTSRISQNLDEAIESVYPNYFNYCPRDEEQTQEQLNGVKSSLSKQQKFFLFVHDREGLINLSKICAKNKRSRTAINRLLAEEKTRELSLIGLRALYSQWNKSLYKDPASVEISRNYWITKVNNPNPESDTKELANVGIRSEPFNLNSSQSLGKRIMKRKYPIDDQDDSLSSNDDKPNEENVSDWEDGNIRRSRRIKKVRTRPRFFDQKYMNFDEDTLEEDVFVSKWKNITDGKVMKKPRRKQTRETYDSPKSRLSRRGPTKRMTKKLAFGGPRSIAAPVIVEEPYMPPTEVLQLPQPQQFSKDQQTGQFSQRDASKSELLSDLSVWDFGLTGFPAFTPLKPVDDAALPDDGDKKLLELGAVMKTESKTPVELETAVKIKPVVEPIKPINHRKISFDKPNLIVNPCTRKEPSRIVNRSFLPRQELKVPRLITGVIPSKPGEMVFLNKVKLPVHHLPQPNLIVKRKVHLPARPLAIPLVKNTQEMPIFENRTWKKHPLSERTVLYISTGTPTITIPSASGSNEERTLAVL